MTNTNLLKHLRTAGEAEAADRFEATVPPSRPNLLTPGAEPTTRPAPRRAHGARNSGSHNTSSVMSRRRLHGTL